MPHLETASVYQRSASVWLVDYVLCQMYFKCIVHRGLLIGPLCILSVFNHTPYLTMYYTSTTFPLDQWRSCGHQWLTDTRGCIPIMRRTLLLSMYEYGKTCFTTEMDHEPMRFTVVHSVASSRPRNPQTRRPRRRSRTMNPI